MKRLFGLRRLIGTKSRKSIGSKNLLNRPKLNLRWKFKKDYVWKRQWSSLDSNKTLPIILLLQNRSVQQYNLSKPSHNYQLYPSKVV